MLVACQWQYVRLDVRLARVARVVGLNRHSRAILWTGRQRMSNIRQFHSCGGFMNAIRNWCSVS